MTSVQPRREPTLSIRLVWPFARLTGSTAAVILDRAGISAADFADPDTRIPRSRAIELLEQAVETLGDPRAGLRAAEQFEPGDFDVLEYAARSAPTLGEAVACMTRYFQLMDDAADISLDQEGDRAVWHFRLRGGLPQPPPANDFVVASALAFSRRNVAIYEPPIEVHLAHERPTYAEAYDAAFGAPVRFGAPCNAIVIWSSRLAVPMARANPKIAEAFELHARRLLEGLRKTEGVAGRVRDVVSQRLGTGSVSMRDTAKNLAMGVATLRRRLEEEGVTFSDIVDEVRRRLAQQYLRDPALTVTEIAFLLGFSNVTAFSRAFKRWTGVTPVAHRARESG